MKNLSSAAFALILILLLVYGYPVFGGSRTKPVVEEAKKDFYAGRYFNALEGFITGLEQAGFFMR